MEFLDKSYMETFVAYLNKNICPLAKAIITETDTCDTLFLGTLNYGFKAVIIRYFELLRYIGMGYKSILGNDILNTSDFYEISI